MSSRRSDSRDILDHASQQYNRAKGSYPLPQNNADTNMVKNMYRQQLDELMKQKNEQKRRQKELQQQQRQQYNERLNFGKQAERLKDLSYKNYYQHLLNNQNKLTQNYPGLNSQRDHLKDHLIQQGIEEERNRSQKLWELQQSRLQNQKRNYRQELERQINQKHLKEAHERQQRNKMQEDYKKMSFSSNEVARMERDRKLMQMSKYKQDLQRTSPSQGQKTRRMTGSKVLEGSSNDFNIFNQSYHNPMTNPLPQNVQNPYILRELMRKEQQMKQGLGNFGQ